MKAFFLAGAALALTCDVALAEMPCVGSCLLSEGILDCRTVRSPVEGEACDITYPIVESRPPMRLSGAGGLSGTLPLPLATIVDCNRDIAGYKIDPVVLRRDRTVVEGSCKYLAHYGQAWYAFSSPENAATFQADPEAYQAKFGWFCAMGAAGYEPKNVPPHLTPASPLPPGKGVVDWYNGEPYLNTDAEKSRLWWLDPEGNILRAKANFASGSYTVRFSERITPQHPNDF